MRAGMQVHACAVAFTQCLRTRPSAAGGVIETSGSLCCAAFALGSPSSTTCPASYARLDIEDACKSAADAASKAFGGSVAHSYHPYGCYWHTVTGSVYYNTNAAGAADAFAQPLCAGAAPSLRTANMRLAGDCGTPHAANGPCIRATAGSRSGCHLHNRTRQSPILRSHLARLNAEAGTAATATPPRFNPPTGTGRVCSVHGSGPRARRLCAR